MVCTQVSLQDAGGQKLMPIETSFIFVKPEEVESGRAIAVLTFIEDYCRKNGLVMETRDSVLDRRKLERHFLDRGDEYLLRVGKKAVDALRECKLEQNIDEKAFAVKLLRRYVDSYEGRKIVAVRITGPGAIEKLNRIKGCTDPRKAAPDTIRGAFATSFQTSELLTVPLRNIVHAAETEDEVKYDLGTFWPEDTLHIDS